MMLKPLCILFSLALFAPTVALAGPIIVGGAGASEYSILFVKNHLNSLLKDCRNLSCDLNSTESEAVDELQTQVQRVPDVVFKRASEVGTALYQRAGEEVWINQDLLWLDSEKTLSYDIAEALSLWTRILSEQSSISEVTVQRLQEKMRITFRQSVTRGQFEPLQDQIFEFVLWKNQLHQDLFVIRDMTFQSVDLSKAIRTQLKCQDPNDQIQIFSPGWLPVRPRNARMIVTISFGVQWQCKSGRGNSFGKAVLMTEENLEFLFAFQPESLIIYVSQEQKP